MADTAELKPCFFISPIGKEGSDTRKKADIVLEFIVRPALEEIGFRVDRGDEESRPGIITSQLYQRLQDDELVIADLTDHNANVFYELAIRHCVKKPFVHIIEKGQPVPFDIGSMRAIEYEATLPGAPDAKAAIIRAARAALDGQVETPIGNAIQLGVLEASEAPSDKVSVQILERLERMEDYLRREAKALRALNQVHTMVVSNKLLEAGERARALDMTRFLYPHDITRPCDRFAQKAHAGIVGVKEDNE